MFRRIFHGVLSLLTAAIAIAMPLAGAQADDSRRKVILDDDGFSLMQMMVLRANDVDVLGVTTVSGDMWANRATAYALRGEELLGRTDVPVIQGATFPLVNSEALTERWEALYGKLTWKGAWMKHWVEPTIQSLPDYHGPNDPVSLPWGNPTHPASDEIAANFLIRMVHRYPGEVTIVACGPMTNLALAQRLDPAFASLAKGLVYMGGSFNPLQVLDNPPAAQFAREFANSPRREFNFRFDPEAASIVLHAPWRAIVAVPVDPSTATQLTPALIAKLVSEAQSRTAPDLSPKSDLSRVLANLPPNFPLWDEIAAAVWLDPTLIRESEPLYVDVDTQFGPGYGDQLSWRAGYQPGLGEQQAQVVRSVDVQRMEALIVRLIGSKR